MKKKEVVKEQESKVLTLSDATRLMFILIPYVKTAEGLITEFKDKKSDGMLFLEVAQSLITQLREEELAEVVGILFGIPTEEAKKMPIKDVSLELPRIIYDNKIVEIFLLFKMLGLFK